MRRVHALTLAAIAGLVALAGAGCNGVLGIGEATLDPTIGGDSGTDGGLTPCQTYCNAIQAACTGNIQQYVTTGVCLAFCNTWDIGGGMAGDDTVNCRINHLPSMSAPTLMACNIAGPTGGGVCGDACHNFCALDEAFCSPSTGQSDPYPDNVTCLADCTKYAHDMSGEGIGIIAAGDTLECRYYHLEASQQTLPSSAGIHCPHTAQNSSQCFSIGDAGGD